MVVQISERLGERIEERMDTWAPTARFRWAKSSPSSPPILQQGWINVLGQPGEEWREIEVAVLGEDPAT